MAKVNFKRIENSANIDSISVEDGNFIVTGDGKSYIDYGTERVPTNGTLDTEMSDTSRNGVENKVIKQYVDESVANSRSVIAWTNPSPTSSFEGQTVTMSAKFSDGYDSYEILFRQNNNESNTRLMSTGIIPSSNGTILHYATSVANFRATITTMYDQTFTFENGNPSNTICIPVYIILHNTGLFE